MKLFLSLLLFIPAVSLAQFGVVDNDTRVVDQNADDAETGLVSGSNSGNEPSQSISGEDLGSTGGFNVTRQGGLDGTGQASGQGSMVLGLGLAMGTQFLKPCTAPFGQWACPLAAMAFADALAGRGAQQSASQTGTYLDPTHGTGQTPDMGVDPLLAAQAEEGLQALSDLGYTVNGDGSVNLPDGQSVTLEEAQSMDGLQGMGMSADAASKAMNQIGSIKSAAMKKAGLDPEKIDSEVASGDSAGSFGGSGGGGGAVSGLGGDVLIEEVEYRNKKKKDKRLPASEAAKLSKNFNGDPIGIGMADLFLIVHQKYREKKKNKKEFIRKEY